MWVKKQEPVVRFKGVKGGDRGTLSVIGGRDATMAFMVDADYQTREWIVWFQGLDDDDGPGEEVIRLPWLQADPWAFEAWNHQGHLKIAFKMYDKQGDTEGPRHRELGVYATGYFDL